MFQSLLQTAWLIPCYALVGAVLSIPWSPGMIRKTGPRPAGYINVIMTLIAFIHGILALLAAWGHPAQAMVIPWLRVANLDLSIPLEISTLTLGATILITGVNLAAQIFAVGYLEMDWGWARFYSLMALFEAGMCGLALCDSLFFAYIILEILTLGTYLLIGLWFNQSLVVTGARDAFLTKRVGDLILLMGVLALYPLAGTWDFKELAVWAQTAEVNPTVMALIGLALVAGPMGKSAQFPLHLWLDEAMEGPIPSTILRNSLVVATGSWVLIKLEPVFALSPLVMAVIVTVGAVTAVGSALIAIAQIDIKRALSYLVSAYMGIIFIAVGTGQPETALRLIFPYALAMSVLVMVVGNIIWNNVTQDLTQYGGLWSRRPITALSFIVGSLGLVAMPPLGSFWALLKMVDHLWHTQPVLVGVLLTVNGLTAFGLARVFGLLFMGQPQEMTMRSPEALWPLVLPMVIGAGFTLHIPQLLGVLHLLPNGQDLNLPLAGTLLVSSVVGFGAGAFIYWNHNIPKPIQFPSKALQDFFAYDLYTAQLYRITIVFAVGVVSQIIYWVDRYIVDGFVNLVGLATVFSGQSLKYNVSGQAQFYVLSILLGIALFGFLVSFPILTRIPLILGG